MPQSPNAPISQSPARPARRRAFTLVELLVTIGILAILAGILIPAIGKAIQRGEIARAQTEMSSISSACMAFFKEYGLWPVDTSNGFPDNTFAGKEHWKTNAEVMDILRARNTVWNQNHKHNPRKIVFLEIPNESLVGTDRYGRTYVANDGFFLDPWGTPYLITMDSDYDGELGIGTGVDAVGLGVLQSIARASGSGYAIITGVRCAVMSYGPTPGDANSFLFSWGSK